MRNLHILLSVLLITVAAFGVRPVLQAVQEKEQENQQLFAQKQHQIERLAEVEAAAKDPKMQFQIPETPAQINLIDDLSRIAKTTGIALPDNWNFSLGHNSAVNAEQVGVNFTLSGRREQIQKFLEAIEQNPRFMGVETFSFHTDFNKSIATTEMPISLYAFFLEA